MNTLKTGNSLFQFPSNGKDFPNSQCLPIPDPSNLKFQFPSNGKDFPNRVEAWRAVFYNPDSFNSLQTGRTFRTERDVSRLGSKICVSIPFKREGLSERWHVYHTYDSRKSGFNSLQTGRTFRT